MILMWLLADLPLRAVPAVASSPDLPHSAPVLETDPSLGGLNSPAKVSAVTITETKQLLAKDGIYEDLFGTAVAIEGLTVVVGAPQAPCYSGGQCLPGSASVFTQTMTGGWPEQVLAPSDGQPNDFYGEAIAISGDTLVIGADEDGYTGNYGSVYIYYRSQSTPGAWVFKAKQVATYPDDYLFGDAVAISGDTLVVGARSFWGDIRGAAYIFERNQGGPDAWGLVKRWFPNSNPPVNNFGESVSIDGDTLVVGTRGEVYVYDRDLGGSGAWGQRQRILPPGEASVCFGESSSINGNTMVVGDRCGNGQDIGIAHVYERNPVTRKWSMVRPLTASDSTADGWLGEFGKSVSLDGDTIVVGAPLVRVGANGGQGAAYLFCRNAGGSNAWGEAAQLITSNGARSDNFGTSVAAQGERVAVGAPYADPGGISARGAAYLYNGCKTPLVFVPGIGGTFLDDKNHGNQRLWIDISTSPKPLSLFAADGFISTTDIIPSEVIPRVPVPVLPDKIIYEPFIDTLVSQGWYRLYRPDSLDTNLCKRNLDDEKPSLFLFPYDWRKDIAETADTLEAFITCVRSFYPNTNVNILAHSMGGLVSRRYILDNPNDHHVNALITLGTPWLGAPKATYVLETGNFFNDKFVDLIRHEIIKEIIGSFTGADQLNPGPAWFELGGLAPVREEGVDLDGNLNDHDLVFTYEQYKTALNNRYGWNKNGVQEFQPGTLSFDFHTYPGQDDWTQDEMGIPYHHIYGWQAHNRTIIQTVFYKGEKCKTGEGSKECSSKFTAVPTHDAGDGTVPLLSLVRIGDGKNYNAQERAWLYRITNQDDELASHVGMFSNLEVTRLVLNILASPSKPGPAGVSASQVEQSATQNKPLLAEPAQYLTLDGGDEVVVYDALGNSTAPIPGTNARGSVPGVDLFSIGDRAMMAVLPTTQVFTVTFKTADEPLAIDLHTGTGNSTTGLVRYQDITVPAGVQARLVFAPQGMDLLHYDSDGNGVYETPVMPTASVSGATPLDTKPPRVEIGAVNPQLGAALITITATDGGVGVKDIWYSLDGVHFKPYSGPFRVDACQAGAIFAFADDQLANRSSLVEKPLSCHMRVFLPSVNR